MSEKNKALARKFFRMFEIGDPEMADEIIAADYYNHDAPDPNMGAEGVKAAVIMFNNALPDAQFKIAFQLTEGEKVVSRYTWSGTHQGEYFGIPATDKRVKWTVTTTFRIAGGKIRESWINYDRLAIMQQLGVVQGI
jgi:steroid delta-isomerase-like uncharacterized protein